MRDLQERPAITTIYLPICFFILLDTLCVPFTFNYFNIYILLVKF